LVKSIFPRKKKETQVEFDSLYSDNDDLGFC